MARRAATVAVIGAFLGLIAPAAGNAGSTADGAAATRTCGTLPGDGFFNYIKVTGLSCADGRKVANHASRKFCGRSCSVGVEEVKTGNVRVDGFACSVKRGYESSRQRCRRGDVRLVQKSGA